MNILCSVGQGKTRHAVKVCEDCHIRGRGAKTLAAIGRKLSPRPSIQQPHWSEQNLGSLGFEWIRYVR